MADLRITGGAAAPVQPQRPEAVRAAQRAFFQAALQGVQPVAPTPAQTTRPAATVQPQAAAPSAEPQRYLRPGSLVDIKV